MESERSWSRVGRMLGWLVAVAFFAAAVVFMLLQFDITAPSLPASLPADFPNRLEVIFENEQERWPQEVAASLLFTLAFVGVGGLAFALRDTFGRRDARSSLMAGSLLLAATLGIAGQFGRMRSGIPSDRVPASS